MERDELEFSRAVVVLLGLIDLQLGGVGQLNRMEIL
jgi:hypothetical protein